MPVDAVPSRCESLEGQIATAMATVETPADVDDVALIAAALIESCGWSLVDTTLGGR